MGVGWKWETLQHRLLATYLVRLATISLRSNPLDYDRMGWLKLGEEKFSVKTTYQLANDWMEGRNWEGWKLLWKMKTQQRVKVFAWVLAYDKLMTNKERWRSRLGHSAVCGRCAQDEVGALHAIRDSKWTREAWEYLLPSELAGEIFSRDLQPFLDDQEGEEGGRRIDVGGEDDESLLAAMEVAV